MTASPQICYTTRLTLPTPTDTKPIKKTAPIKPRAVIKLAILALLGLAVVAFFEYDLDYYFSLQTLKKNRDTLLAYTQSHYWQAAFIFAGCYFLQTTFSLLSGAIMTLAGGFLFGSVIGTLDEHQSPIYGAVTGDYAIAKNGFFVHAKIGAAMLHKNIPFLKTIFVKQDFDPPPPNFAWAGFCANFGMISLIFWRYGFSIKKVVHDFGTA